ncbi:TPA: hypothetical protein ACWX1I_003255 [Elizabethkingia anophelis]
MYQRISNFTPLQIVPSNVINIKLGHQLTELPTIVKTATVTIFTITNARIAPHFTASTIALASGAFNRTGTAATTTVVFGATPGTTMTSTPTYVNGSVNASFLANITMESSSVKSVNLANKLTIIPGNQQSLTFNVKRCGAMVTTVVNSVSTTAFREFSCHNVGADTSGDPFKAAAAMVLNINWEVPQANQNVIFRKLMIRLITLFQEGGVILVLLAFLLVSG